MHNKRAGAGSWQHPYWEILCALPIALTHKITYSLIGEILSKQDTDYWLLIISPWDLNIPYVPFFSLPYLFVWLYAFSVLIYSIVCKTYNYQLFRYFYLSFLTLTVIESLIWMNFPASITIRVPADVLANSGLFGSLTSYAYEKATPWNVFPSAHIASAYIILLFSKHFAVKGQRRYFLFLSTLICFSVVLIKNHYLADVAGGIVLGHLVYRFVFIPAYKKEIFANVSTSALLIFSYSIFAIAAFSYFDVLNVPWNS